MSYQSDYSGAQVDEAVGKALNPDAAPTQNSTNLVESGGVASAVSAVQNTVSRRNLLDNGWFTVNQRGQASYTGNAYTVDRWRFQNNYGTCNVVTGGITFSNSASGYGYFAQILDFTLDSAKTYTLSVIADGQVYSARSGGAGITLPSGLYFYFANSTQISMRVPGNLNSSEVISAVKLELGSVSTLANDAPPCFAEELAKCQRYFYNTGATSSAAIAVNGLRGDAAAGKNMGAQVITPVVMRTTPTVDATMSSIRGNGSIWNSSLSVSNTPLAVFGNLVILDVQCSTASFPAYTNGYAVIFSKLQLSADL